LKIVAIIPCYDVGKYCLKVIEETLNYVAFLVLIDDGSRDETGAILHQMQQKHQEKIHLIVFPKNRGKGVALLKGIEYALSLSLDILVTLDSDGQHLPAEIPQLASHVAQGADLVIGCRQFDQMPFRSRLANTFLSFLLRHIHPKAPNDTQSGFRAFSPKLAQKVENKTSGNRYDMEFRCLLMALRDGDKVECCPIQTIYLDENRSSHFAKIRDSVQILKVFLRYWISKSL